MAKVERRMREEDGFREKLMELEKNLVEGRKRKIKKERNNEAPFPQYVIGKKMKKYI
jgi:hypothetical protein